MKKTLGSLLIGICAILSAAEITLAENGEARASIVIPENAKPIVKFAAQELADHLSVDRCALCTEISSAKITTF